MRSSVNEFGNCPARFAAVKNRHFCKRDRINSAIIIDGVVCDACTEPTWVIGKLASSTMAHFEKSSEMVDGIVEIRMSDSTWDTTSRAADMSDKNRTSTIFTLEKKVWQNVWINYNAWRVNVTISPKRYDFWNFTKNWLLKTLLKPEIPLNLTICFAASVTARGQAQ